MTNIAEKYKRGFDRLAPDTMGICSYNTGTRTFSVAVKGGENYFSFFAGGKYYTKTTTQSVIRPDTTGTYYFYFDVDGVLQYVINTGFSGDDFKTVAITGLVYWNATTGEAIVQAVDEQHGIMMDSATHFNLHTTRGAKYAQGGDVVGLSDGSSTYTSIGVLLSEDEDIGILTPETTTTPFLYRIGADGEREETATPDLNIGYDGGGNTYYNERTGATWQLTAGGNQTDFVIYYFLRTNDANNPIKKIVGQQAYGSRADARNALQNEIGKLEIDGFPSTEAYLMYAYIVQRNGDLEDDGDGNTYVDLRRDLIFNNS